MKQPSAAVWGANGYLGRHMARHLVQQGWDVTAYGVHRDAAADNSVPYYHLDVTDKAQIEQLSFRYDYLFYFPGLAGTDISFENYEQFVNVNELGLLNLLNHLRGQAERPRIIFPSTRLVYKGVENTPLAEDAEKEFKTIYASSKYNGELYLAMYRNLYGQPYTVFRICVPYGNAFPSDLSYGTISFFLGRAQKGETLTLFGDGALKRTFTHVEDICRQMAAASLAPGTDGECYNIDGETFSLREVAEVIASKYGVQVTYSPWPDKALKLESGDTIFEGRKIRSLLDSTLQHSFHSWIQNS